VIMRDKTGRSRGFGFITLASVKEIDIAISYNLFLDGRKVEAKKAIPKSDLSNHAKKIFVGGIPMSLTNADFRKYFETFGNVLETQIMTDRESGRSRGFGFVTFEEETIATEVLMLSHTIQGKPVEVKQAEPKNNSQTVPTQGAPPIAPIYFPSNLSYSSAFNNPLSLEQATYLAQTQGGVVYVPHVYEPLSPLEGQGFNITDPLIRRSNTVPVLQKPIVPSTNQLRMMPSFYEKQTEIHTPPTQLKSPIGLELRTERAFSEPRTERGWNMPDHDVWGTRLGKYSPPLKRRNGSQSISVPSGSTFFSNPPSGLLRTDPNWFKSSLITESLPSLSHGQKYYQ